jgi:hypothetical protein
MLAAAARRVARRLPAHARPMSSQSLRPSVAVQASQAAADPFAAACTPVLGPPPSTPAQAAATLVLYHWPCFDGAGAALCAWLALSPLAKRADGARVGPVFIPHPVTRPLCPAAAALLEEAARPPAGAPPPVVYLLDFAGPPGFAVGLAKKLQACGGRVVVLDHHKTAAEELPGGEAAGRPPNLEVRLEAGRSGAGLAAAHFFEERGRALPPNVARLVAAIQDGDLWRWEGSDSKAVYAGLGAAEARRLHRLDAGGGAAGGGTLAADRATAVEAADRVFGALAALDMDALVAEGAELLEAQAAEVGAAADGAAPIQLGGAAGKAAGWGIGLGVSVHPDLARHRSALGNELASRAAALAAEEPGVGWVPVGVVAYRDPTQPAADGRLKVSLRSVGPDADTTAVTKALGGGGHANASSCMVEGDAFREWWAVGV